MKTKKTSIQLNLFKEWPYSNSPRQETGFEIRHRRLEIGWTQAELASQAGITQAHLSMIERGLCASHLQTLLKLNEILSFAEDSIFGFGDERDEDELLH